MGQYWYPVNLDKKEYLDPHKLGTGLKLWEQLANHPGTGAALIILCAAMPERRGGGDLAVPEKGNIIGRWAGDRIALVGDYAKDSDLKPEFEASHIYDKCQSDEYLDITEHVCKIIEHELDGKYEGTGWRDFVQAKQVE